MAVYDELERWHDPALETRAMARKARKAQDQRRLLKVARSYERLAAGARTESG